MSSENKKVALVESLVFAAVLAVASAALFSLGLLADSRRASFERNALTALAKRPISGAAIRLDDPIIPRAYRIGGKGEALFGLMLPLRSGGKAVLAAALVTPDGGLKSYKVFPSSAAEGIGPGSFGPALAAARLAAEARP